MCAVEYEYEYSVLVDRRRASCVPVLVLVQSRTAYRMLSNRSKQVGGTRLTRARAGVHVL